MEPIRLGRNRLKKYFNPQQRRDSFVEQFLINLDASCITALSVYFVKVAKQITKYYIISFHLSFKFIYKLGNKKNIQITSSNEQQNKLNKKYLNKSCS